MKTYKVCDNVVIESVCGACLLIRTGEVPGKKGKVLPINDVGAYFVKLLDGTSSVKQLSENAATHYGIEQTKAFTDMLTFMERLHELGYIDEV